MSERVRVGISEYKIAQAPTLLMTYGLGSCLGITLYDATAAIGGLAHTLLPYPREGMDLSRPAKFVDAAIRLMLTDLLQIGCSRQRLVAKMFGGANMFEGLQNPNREGIGQRNIRSARETLADLGIPLTAEDVGGNFGRTVEFDVATGAVLIRSVRDEQRERHF
jgi:chemotaxis protein CheD